jgi:acyl-CoA synthetase (NDP forming)
MGYSGGVNPVNPGYREIRGLKCYSTSGEIKDLIDIAVFAVPAASVIEILKGPLENIRGAIIVSSGFREIGPEGNKMETYLKEFLEEKGIRAMGPNCLGIYDTISNVDTFFIDREKGGKTSQRRSFCANSEWVLCCYDYGRASK